MRAPWDCSDCELQLSLSFIKLKSRVWQAVPPALRLLGGASSSVKKWPVRFRSLWTSHCRTPDSCFSMSPYPTSLPSPSSSTSSTSLPLPKPQVSVCNWKVLCSGSKQNQNKNKETMISSLPTTLHPPAAPQCFLLSRGPPCVLQPLAAGVSGPDSLADSTPAAFPFHSWILYLLPWGTALVSQTLPGFYFSEGMDTPIAQLSSLPLRQQACHTSWNLTSLFIRFQVFSVLPAYKLPPQLGFIC